MYCPVRFSQFRESQLTVGAYTFLGISCVVLAIFTVFWNSLILHALRKCQTLHAPTKALFCSLAFSDLGVGIVVFPIFAAICFAAISNNIEVFCAIRDLYVIAGYCLGSVSFFTMTAISLDRIYAFTLKSRYHQFVTFKRVVLLLAGCWIFGVIWPFSWFISENMTNFLATVIIFCSVVTSSILYIKIAIGIRRHQRQIQEQRTYSAPQRHGGNNFSISQYKRSLNTMILVFCILLACYLPYFVVSLNVATGSNSNTNLAMNITATVIKLNSLLNPLVYCWRIREIRREVMNVLRCFTF
ncbi:melanocyte-stimulating hormone receptor-like [Oculina patagonica]